MTKASALKEITRMAEAKAEGDGLLMTPQAADFYDMLALALESDCSEEAARAANLASLVRETERAQLKFRELLRS